MRLFDDLILFTDESRSTELRRVPFLRQQRRSAGGRPNHCLADFVAPAGSGLKDWVGGFVVTTGLGAREASAKREADDDDYRSIMVKALADRLALRRPVFIAAAFLSAAAWGGYLLTEAFLPMLGVQTSIIILGLIEMKDS